MLQQMRKRWAVAIVATLVVQSIGPLMAADRDGGDNNRNTTTPIKHVVVLIGENRTFDHVFATYVPPNEDSIANLLAKGIVNADGSPGPHFSKAAQFQAVAPFRTEF